MTEPTNSVISDSDWRRLAPQTREYAAAGFELIDEAYDHLQEGNLRQASEKGLGSVAQVVKAVAQNREDAGVTHGRHQYPGALVAGLAAADREPGLDMLLHAAQDLHENIYGNNPPQYMVDLNLRPVDGFITMIAPQLRRPVQTHGFRQGR